MVVRGTPVNPSFGGGRLLGQVGLSPSYGLPAARDAHEWFIGLVREHEEFEVETDRAGEPPFSFWSETVRRVVAT